MKATPAASRSRALRVSPVSESPAGRPPLHIDAFGDGEPAVFVHGIFGWGLDYFSCQLPLADRYRLLIVDRRGYGSSPAMDDPGWHYDVDDITELLGDGAHLVGASAGANSALLAAGRKPSAVRSLVVVEPLLTILTADQPVAVTFSEAVDRVYQHRAEMSAEEFHRAWSVAHKGAGATVDTSTYAAADWAAVEASRKERPFWDAPVDLVALRDAPFPKVVVRGRWASETGRNLIRDLAWATCDALAAAIGAEQVVFDGSSHNPQLEEPERFNDLLRRVWAQ